jgi:alpha-tubulin suppressor-like RCC1 family protein
MPNFQKVTKVAGGIFFSLALTSTGEVFAWGQNNYGQLGCGDIYTKSSPTKVLLPVPVAGIAAAQYAAFAWTAEGALYCWGWNYGGALGVPSGEAKLKVPALHPLRNIWYVPGFPNSPLSSPPFSLPSPSPLPSPLSSNLTRFRYVCCGSKHFMALTVDGFLYSWGYNGRGALGLGHAYDKSNPELVLTGVSAVACGSDHTLALRYDGTLLAWGHSEHHSLGLGGASMTRTVPHSVSLSGEPSPGPLVRVPAGQVRGGPKMKVAFIGCGSGSSFAITEEGDLYAWGLGINGELGLGEFKNQETPKKLEGFKFRVPQGSLIAQRWKNVFAWLFLGIIDPESIFYRIPIEVIFNFINVT